MTEVKGEDGATIKTDLPAEAVADLQPKAEEKPADATPPKGQEAEPPKPADTPKEETPAAAPAETPKEETPKDDKGKFIPKPKPIANLLAKKHELETSLAEKDKMIADLQGQVQKFSQKPDNAATDDDIKAFAEEIGADASVIEKLVAFARKGLIPALPKEVQDLIAKQKESEAIEKEHQVFENRVSRLGKALPGEPIEQYKDKLMELAYSDQVAPDGERYADKELAELYFGFIKPEIEPGKVSGEQGRAPGGTRSSVIDFQAIFDKDDPKDIQSMNDETFKKYSVWLEEKGNKTGAIVQRF